MVILNGKTIGKGIIDMAHKRKDTLAKVVSPAGWHKHLREHKRAQSKLERATAKRLIKAEHE